MSNPKSCVRKGMTVDYLLTTPRLGLRRWLPGDSGLFAAMNADPEVMRFFPRMLSRSETEVFIQRIEAHFDRHGYGLYAVEERETGRFIGFIGFQWARLETDFTPCIEIGWRLERTRWGMGYATEGARKCLRHGFETLGFQAVFSFTSSINRRSIAVMERIGLKYRKNFGHPGLPPDHALHDHVLYSITRMEFDCQVHDHQFGMQTIPNSI